MSNFKRNDNQKKEDPYKAYFGHPELDALLGNNIFKGQIIFIEQDNPTTIYKQLLRYCIGNSYHKNHISIIYDQFCDQWKKIIPKKLIETPQEQQQVQQQNHKIAWRYNQMQQQYTIKNIDQSISYLDLSKVETQEAVENHLKLNNYEGIENLQQFLQHITKQYQKSLKSSTDSTMKKLVLVDFLDKIPHTNEELLIFFYSLKVLLRSSFMLCVMTFSEKNYDLIQFCDFYITITQLFGNKEFSDFQGMIKFDKIGWSNSLKQVQLENDKWGIKLSQKQLKIEQLYETAIEEDSDEEVKQKGKVDQF